MYCAGKLLLAARRRNACCLAWSGLLRTWPAQQLLRLPSLMQLPQHILMRAKPGASQVLGRGEVLPGAGMLSMPRQGCVCIRLVWLMMLGLAWTIAVCSRHCCILVSVCTALYP